MQMYTGKQKWTKKGWVSVGLTAVEKEQLQSINAHLPYQREEMNFEVTRRNDITALDEIQQTIQVGNTHTEIDALPYALQHVLREEDKFHVSNGKMFRIVDPITQALDGDWGTDKSEADFDLLTEHNSIGRQYLQMTHQLSSEASELECTDMLGVLSENSNGELLNTSPFVRMDVPLESIGQLSAAGDIAELDNDSGYEEEDFECGHQMNTPILPEISVETMTRADAIRAEWMPKIAAAVTEEDKEITSLIMDQALDRVLEQELANRIDSPWLGYQYSPPRRKHVFIQLGSESYLTVSAEERKTLFFKLFSEASSCKSNSDLYGENRDGGFYGKIREHYAHDRDLAKDWSIDNFTDKEKVVHISAFNAARQNFIDVWRNEGKTDEEKLRKVLYVFFDRVAGEYPAVYKDGQLVRSGRKERDSHWRVQRTEALRDLFLTKNQWNAIYQMLNLVKKRISLNTYSTDDSRQASEILHKNFERINNLSDLSAYKQWATKHKWIRKESEICSRREDNKAYKRTVFYDSYEFVPSYLDRMSITSEARWHVAMRKKENSLKQRIRMFSHLESVIKEVQSTNLPEVSVVCPHRELIFDKKAKRMVEKNCDKMAIGVPQFAVLQDNKGICFVQCECGKKVWLIESHESGSDARAMEEWTSCLGYRS